MRVTALLARSRQGMVRLDGQQRSSQGIARIALVLFLWLISLYIMIRFLVKLKMSQNLHLMIVHFLLGGEKYGYWVH